MCAGNVSGAFRDRTLAVDERKGSSFERNRHDGNSCLLKRSAWGHAGRAPPTGDRRGIEEGLKHAFSSARSSGDGDHPDPGGRHRRHGSCGDGACGDGFSVQLNLGDGTLGEVATFPVTEQPSDIDSGDLDGDGDVDLVVVSNGNDLANTNVDIYRNDGAGSFTRSTTVGGRGPEAVSLADLDGNGALDIAIASDAYSTEEEGPVTTLSILPGNGNAPSARRSPCPSGPG